MKKLLFATTALIATAGVAAAEIEFSGYGRFGLDYNDANDPDVNGVSETNITSRLRLQFDMSAETDAGIGFNARLRAQAESRDNNPETATLNGARFGVSYGGFSVNVGNTTGAIENTPGLYLGTKSAGIGIDGAGFVSVVTNVNGNYFNWDAYDSTGAGVNGVEALYEVGGFTGHVSYSDRNKPNAMNNNGGFSRTAVMLTYSFEDITISGSHQSSEAQWEDKTVLTASYEADGWGARLAYADNDGIGKWGIYGNVDIGAASNLLLFVTDEDAVSASDVAAGRNDNRDNVAGSNNEEGTSYGIHYSYDLGGGVLLETGYRRASNDNNTFQAGVYFAF